jgi:LPS-assembly protein
MDWVRAADVPDAQRNLRCELCGGRYIDPLAGRRDEDPDAAPIRARARRTELQGSTVTLSGGVEVVQGYREFSSDAASIDRSSRTGVLEGNIEVREPGVLLRGERGEYTSAAARRSSRTVSSCCTSSACAAARRCCPARPTSASASRMAR